MICKSCRAGGNFSAALDYAPATGSDLGNIQELHSQCKGGTFCDCQHDTALLVRRPNAKP